MYPEDPYWKINNFPTFPDKSHLISKVRVKEYFNQLSSGKSQLQKDAAKVRPLSPVEQRKEMIRHITHNEYFIRNKSINIDEFVDALIDFGMGSTLPCHSFIMKNLETCKEYSRFKLLPPYIKGKNTGVTEMKKAIVTALNKVGTNVSNYSDEDKNDDIDNEFNDNVQGDVIQLGEHIPSDMTEEELADELSDDEDDNNNNEYDNDDENDF